MTRSIYDRYPGIAGFRRLLSDETIDREIGAGADEFERVFEEARKRIPTVRLGELFPATLEHGAIRLENFLGHWGNHRIEETAKVCLIVRWLAPRRILEIGTFNGLTTLQMALNAPSDCRTYTLDLAPGTQSVLPTREVDHAATSKALSLFGTEKGSYFSSRSDLNITQLFGDAATFDYAAVIDGPVDLVLIDAAKDYEHLRVDTENALRMLAPGGLVLWSNYGDVDCSDVTRFLLDLSQRIPLHHIVGTTLAAFWSGLN
jgi:predicted O-methyltransferase YrrM